MKSKIQKSCNVSRRPRKLILTIREWFRGMMQYQPDTVYSTEYIHQQIKLISLIYKKNFMNDASTSTLNFKLITHLFVFYLCVVCAVSHDKSSTQNNQLNSR